jgi:hypothetical protein
MALYKNAQLLKQSSDAAFDQIHGPGVAAPYAGIYRCAVCGHEIAIAYGHTLPPQGHSQHPAGRPIQWQLAVFAQHNS